MLPSGAKLGFPQPPPTTKLSGRSQGATAFPHVAQIPAVFVCSDKLNNPGYKNAFLNVVIVSFLPLSLFFHRALLILDDIWDSTVLKAFDIHCRILLTTRNRSLADCVSGMWAGCYSIHQQTSKWNKPAAWRWWIFDFILKVPNMR